ncbi:Spindle pole body protein [Handroanthus impetiginosus]|uniref:Spindle pole body protein n=1 Tax=Handroanthus impetiginosus TaxID=429701 RepID=A0A2G9I4R0_9LAMI|nr:Spindle pole body protein [Handroanthus impetiginosus]
MSMLDSLFKQRFNAARCKTLLKLTIPRIKLLRNRREIQLKQMRREIAKLLETGQEATARIRVEHIIREEKMMAAQEIVELFCELISVRLPIIEAQRECPLDLKEAISSVCFAAPRCADLPELLQVQMLFAGKYGKEFVSAATELMPECGVNRQLIELLSIRAPAPDVKLNLLKEIAEEHELDWDPSATESELLKPHEDLLNGPTQFVSGSKVPLPKEEKHEDMTYTTSQPASEPEGHEHSDSDADFDIIDFPEVPKQPLPSSKGTVSVPEMLPFPASALSEADDQEPKPLSQLEKDEDASPKTTASLEEDKQFLPFITPPSQSSASLPVREHNSPPTISKAKSDNVDLQDVLAAAQAAAETAERAATAARSAASIAQLRISELVKKKNEEVSVPTVENPFHLNKEVVEKTGLDKQNSIGNPGSPGTSPIQNDRGSYASHQPTAYPSSHDPHVASESSSPSNYVHGHHQPQRLPSMDDEAYFSYPNLFKSQSSNLSTRSESFKDSK